MKQSIHDPYDEDWWYLKDEEEDRSHKKLAFKEPRSQEPYQGQKHRKPKPIRVRED